jgi:hypothetical protein
MNKKEKPQKESIVKIMIFLTLVTICMGSLIFGLYLVVSNMDFDYTITIQIDNRSLEALETLNNPNLVGIINKEEKLNYLNLTKEQRHKFYLEFCNDKKPEDIAKGYKDLGNIGSFWCMYHSGYTKHYGKMKVEEFIKNQTEVKIE